MKTGSTETHNRNTEKSKQTIPAAIKDVKARTHETVVEVTEPRVVCLLVQQVQVSHFEGEGHHPHYDRLQVRSS